ncbi:response regulator transcription factor [Aquibacillus rhizosphaerae]|uniref:Response regulator transcription factor n=1 Tax=Aquibacillus rhizosphaerae TaxID=3051431 RepID=A0ABT7LBJ0_9BACI|nr:response regulator transcription factor [Aquibacillus sp. LR5S19]MDL4843218.1 response regulator transcription factor [Aquibacillus sp. LR5S19]
MNVPWKVLIVDDEMLIRQGIINYINWEEEGFQIAGEAGNGKEALQLIEQSQPHIIITDIVMPGMDGIEFVKEVKAKYPTIEILVLSSFENFDYVRSTFQNGVADYILKPKLNGEELINTLRKIAPDRANNESKHQPASVEELLKKSIKGYTLMKGETTLASAFPYSQFIIVAVCRTEDKEKVLTYKEIKDQMAKHMESMEMYSIPNYENAIIYIVNFEPNQLTSIKLAVSELGKKYNDSDYESQWIISKPFSSISQLKEIYEENLLRMKNYFFYLQDRKLIMYDDLPEVVEDSKHFDLNQFIDFFKHKQFSVAMQYLTEHVDSLASNYTKDIFEYKSWLENIIFNIIVLLGNMKYDTADIESKKYDYFTNINEAKHASSALFHFYDFLSEVNKIVLKDNEESPTKMQLLLQYIDDYYSEPLSLTTLANHFHFNASYLSSYFSTHHREGFSEYLNQVRIDKAKLILKSGTISIATVSEMVGYSDPSYFCKVFKRIAGMSPSNYRKEASSMN